MATKIADQLAAKANIPGNIKMCKQDIYQFFLAANGRISPEDLPRTYTPRAPPWLTEEVEANPSHAIEREPLTANALLELYQQKKKNNTTGHPDVECRILMGILEWNEAANNRARSYLASSIQIKASGCPDNSSSRFRRLNKVDFCCFW